MKEKYEKMTQIKQTTFPIKIGTEFNWKYKALVAELTRYDVSSVQIEAVMKTHAEAYGVRLEGSFAKPQTHQAWVRYGSYQSDVLTTKYILEDKRFTIGHDDSTKFHKKYKNVVAHTPTQK